MVDIVHNVRYHIKYNLHHVGLFTLTWFFGEMYYDDDDVCDRGGR